MPFWKRSSPEEKQQQLQAQQEAEQSRQALEAGGLPLRAQRRLREEMEAGHPLFTSDLSVNELLLTREQGYRALSQVMGSSVYQVGWQYARQYSWGPHGSELGTLTQAHQHAAMLALGRLEQEAALLRAHGVIGVRFSRREYDWASNMLEYIAIGTAIRLPGAPPPEIPFLSDLSGQEFWTLLQAGYYPLGVVTGYCSYYAGLGSSLTGQIRGWFGGVNQEITHFSQSCNRARHLAMQRLQDMARSMGAFGVVGMHIDNDRQIIDYELEQENAPTRYFLDIAIHFMAVGTAITSQKKDHSIPSPGAALTLTDLRPGRFGEEQELTLREE